MTWESKTSSYHKMLWQKYLKLQTYQAFFTMCHELHRLSWTAMNCVCLPVQPLLLDPTQNKRSTKNTHESPAVKIVPRTCKTYKNQWHKLCQETELVKNFKICKRTFLSNSEEEVPSLVCCWDRREDSRTRTKWQSHRKTQRQKDLQDGLAEFVHWANYSHDHRGKSNEYLWWEYVMWWKLWKECGNVPTSSTGCLNAMQTSSHDNMVKGWDPQNPRNCSNKTWIGKAERSERSERSEKLQKAQLWTQSKPSKLFESLPPVFETLKQEKLSLLHNNSHDKKT